MENYPAQEIETKWRQKWNDNDSYRVDLKDDKRDKLYVLVMFSYPSEKKLHIGHWWNYGGTDTYARFKKMQGYNVFEPMGFDAFGLPAENYAIKHDLNPADVTSDSVLYIREQLKLIGAMYDWSREVDTSKPEYYKWTQWLFLQLFNRDAAYRKYAPVNWCTNCQTVLANEQVLSDGTCERCSTNVETRDLEQWFFRITDFADDLLDGLSDLDWPESTKLRQKHWIGRSEGTEISFLIEEIAQNIDCFTTRADTLYGATYIVLAPEHSLTRSISTPEQSESINEYVRKARDLSDIERQSLEREKTGVFTGAYAINPANGERLPIWIADYVLVTYGTGAVMAVPAHDQRDFEFAAKYDLPVQWVIKPTNPHDKTLKDRAFTEFGVMCNSAEFDGLSSTEGMQTITQWLERKNAGKAAVSYRLRDWLISRQRYWGAPIPIIHCQVCGIVPVPEEDLPVLLPLEGVDYRPRGTSPLGSSSEFINTTCPKCGAAAKRDADTMDTFVCSSWYYLRYLSTHMEKSAFDQNVLSNWLPVDVYIGGPEHATGHLIYARYIAKFLNSIGLLHYSEPFKKMVHQGIITHQGQRMSKSKGNVVNPDKFIEKYGSDCLRMYLMFMGDFSLGGDWSDEGIIGVRRFQNRVWRLVNNWSERIFIEETTIEVDDSLNRVKHYTIKEVTDDLDNFRFNTAISRLMEFVNELYKYTFNPDKVNISFLRECFQTLIKLLSPLAPHLSEELWERVFKGTNDELMYDGWPVHDDKILIEETVTVVIQINGKLIERLPLTKGYSQDEVFREAITKEKVQNHLEKGELIKMIYIRDRILNIVLKPKR